MMQVQLMKESFEFRSVSLFVSICVLKVRDKVILQKKISYLTGARRCNVIADTETHHHI